MLSLESAGGRGNRGRRVEGEIVDHSRARRFEPEAGEEGFDLPEGAQKMDNPELARLMGVDRVQEIEYYEVSEGWMVPGRVGLEEFDFEESGFESQMFKGRLHPRAEGYYWYRGYAVNLQAVQDLGDVVMPGRQVIILRGWLQPWREAGAPDGLVYVRGGVTEEEAIEVISRYCRGRQEYIDARMFQMREEGSRRSVREVGERSGLTGLLRG